MPRWKNWSGKLSAQPDVIHHVRSEDDAAALTAAAAADGRRIRCVGSGHSHAPLVPTDDVLVDTSGLAGVAAADPDTMRARIRAGTVLATLGRPLHDAGLGLVNQGDIDRQTIAGAAGTGTHGTGVALGSFSSAITAARIATTAGEVIEVSADRDPEGWQAARLNLGALGIVTEVELQCRRAYRLRERGWTESLDDMLDKIDDLIGQHRHFEFFWYPTQGTVTAKAIDETDDPAEYPLADEGSRCAWSYEVLPNRRDWPHTEMEYSVPLDAGPACLGAIRDLLAADFPEMPWPVEYRTLAADDVWLSSAYGRPTVTISVHMDVRHDDEPVFRACEAVFRSFDGRPHWGKVHYLDGPTMAAIHPRWDDWWTVRDRLDPAETFLNDHLQRLRPSS